ncbi:MAG: response regulator [Thioalkalivibrio sp.]|nr:response regulator [Thioalkalivibrio sp.]
MSPTIKPLSLSRDSVVGGVATPAPDAWRPRLLDLILIATFTLGLVTGIPSLVVGIREGLWNVLLVNAAWLLWMATVAFVRQLPFRFRAWNLLLAIYVLGAWFLASVGVANLIYLMAAPILAVLLLGLRPAVLVLVVNALTVVAIGMVASPDLAIPRYDDNPLLKWSLMAMHLTFLSSVLTIGVSFLLRRLEDALAEQRRITAAVEQAGDAVFLGAIDGRLTFANASARALLASAPGFSGKPAERLQHLVRALRGEMGTPDTLEGRLPWEGEIELPGDDDTLKQFQVSISPLRDGPDAEGGFVALMRDVTRERRMEARVRRGERLEALGTLAGGVAHDFNNIVGSILGLVEDARSHDRKGAMSTTLDAMVVACLRAREIVRQMMVFSRKTPLIRHPVRMKDVVEEILLLVRASTPATVKVRSSLASEGYVSATPGEVNQIVMNLCRNSVQAMEEIPEGTLTVHLDDVEPQEAEGTSPSDAPTHIRISVTDTGSGISKEDLPRIFDPFFTTKAASEGTGLGLASVYGIVRGMGGDVQVYSEPGQGTTVRVYLPRAHPVEAAPAATPAADLPVDAPPGRILLVDDEPVLLQMTEKILRRLGHDVTAAPNGAAALDVLASAAEAIDLVITDLTMPTMGGAELIRRIRQTRPDLPVILTSGFADTPEGRSLGSAEGVSFLAKPFTHQELAQAVEVGLAKGSWNTPPGDTT